MDRKDHSLCTAQMFTNFVISTYEIISNSVLWSWSRLVVRLGLTSGEACDACQVMNILPSFKLVRCWVFSVEDSSGQASALHIDVRCERSRVDQVTGTPARVKAYRARSKNFYLKQHKLCQLFLP